MRLEDFLSRNYVFPGLRARDKDELFLWLARFACCANPRADVDEALERLRRREAQGTTGIGNGVAIPHTTTSFLQRTLCALVQVPEGVPYDSLDGLPVYFVFLLLSPSEAIGEHVRLLARIARIAHNAEFIRRLAQAETADEIYRLVIEEDERHP